MGYNRFVNKDKTKNNRYVSSYQRRNDIRIIKRCMTLILYISSVLEILLFPGWNSIVLALTSIISMHLYFYFAFNLDTIRRFPILFFVFSNLAMFMYLPIPLTLLDGVSADHDLFIPLTTYSLQFLYYLITLAAFVLARKFACRNRGLERFLYKHGYYKVPSIRCLWILGFIGLCPLVLLLFGIESGQGTLFLISKCMFAPICILFYPAIGGNIRNIKRHKIFVLLFVVVIETLLMATNKRVLMLEPIIVLVLGLFYYYFLTNSKSSVFTIQRLIIGVVSFVLLTGPFADLAISMVIVRRTNEGLSSEETFKQTWDLFINKEALNNGKKLLSELDETEDLEWNEYYVSNVFFQRFCNYRVVDATLFHAIRNGIPDPRLLDNFVRYLKTLPPEPIPSKVFGVDKNDRYSPLDLMYSWSTNSVMRKSLKIGGDVGIGLGTFGYYWPLLCFITYLCFFWIVANLSIYRRNKKVISIITVVSLMDFFNFLLVSTGIGRHVGMLIWIFWLNTFEQLLIFRFAMYVFGELRKFKIVSLKKPLLKKQ